MAEQGKPFGQGITKFGQPSGMTNTSATGGMYFWGYTYVGGEWLDPSVKSLGKTSIKVHGTNPCGGTYYTPTGGPGSSPGFMELESPNPCTDPN